MSTTRAPSVANAAPASVIKSMARVPAATCAAPAAPESKGSARQNRLPVAMRHVDEIQEDICSFSTPQMVEETAEICVQDLQIREELLEPLLQIKEVIADAVRVLLHDQSLRNADIVGIFGPQTFDEIVDSVCWRRIQVSRRSDERRAVMCQHAEESTAAAGKKNHTEVSLQREVL